MPQKIWTGEILTTAAVDLCSLLTTILFTMRWLHLQHGIRPSTITVQTDFVGLAPRRQLSFLQLVTTMVRVDMIHFTVTNVVGMTTSTRTIRDISFALGIHFRLTDTNTVESHTDTKWNILHLPAILLVSSA